MMKLPLLLNAVPKINLTGPKVFLGDGFWKLYSDDETLKFCYLSGEVQIDQHTTGGDKVISIMILELGKNPRVSIFAEKQEFQKEVTTIHRQQI